MAHIPNDRLARILTTLADARYPREALPTVAANLQLALDDLRPLVEAHGYPDPAGMRRAAERLRTTPTTPSTPSAGGDGVQLVKVPLARIQADPTNIRDDLYDIDDLAASISQVGLLQPIVVRRAGDRLIIVAGHRRAAALRRLGWTETEVLLNPIAEADVLVAMLIENTQRSDLDPIEEARAYALLKERDHLGDLQLAGRVGKSQSHVSARLALLELPEADQAAIRAGTLTLGEGTKRGRKLAGTHRPGALGKASAAHLSEHHPLAAAVEALCRHQGHSKMTAGRVGGVGCGRCWEDVIRSDERTQVERSRRRTDAEAS